MGRAENCVCSYLSLCNGKEVRAGEGGSKLAVKGRALEAGWGEPGFVLGSQRLSPSGWAGIEAWEVWTTDLTNRKKGRKTELRLETQSGQEVGCSCVSGSFVVFLGQTVIARRFMRLVCTLLRSFLRVMAPKVPLEKCEYNNLFRNYHIPLEEHWISYLGLVFHRCLQHLQILILKWLPGGGKGGAGNKIKWLPTGPT